MPPEPENPHSENRKDAIENLYESALEAERETGRREIGDDARRSLIARIASIFLGSVISVLGVLMLVLPGPGLLVLALGLGILAVDVPFARRLLDIVRNRLPQDEKGSLTRGTIALMSILAVAGITCTALSVWWEFFR